MLSTAESAGPADHPALDVSTLAPCVPQPMTSSNDGATTLTSPHPQSLSKGRAGALAAAESTGPADHPALDVSTLAPCVPQPMTFSNDGTTTLTTKDEDDDLLALLFYFVFWRITAPITHPISYSYTHTASTEVGALWSILGVHLKKLMCMETETGGGYTVRLAWGGRNDIRAGEVGGGSERGMEIVGSPLDGYN